MAHPNVTIRSVAQEAGVSIATVSNVLNGRHQQMSPETLERVQEAITRLGYRPNQLAQSLATNRTATIGLIVSELLNPLYPPVILGVEAAVRKVGSAVLLANAPDAERERRAVDAMLSKHVEGLILFSTSFVETDNSQLVQVQRTGTPIVVINRHVPPELSLPRVAFDHFGGSRLATEYLLRLGHRRIAHIAGPPNRFTGRERRAGYAAALAAAGIPLDERLIAEGDYSFGAGRQLLPQVWREHPTAVFVGGDAMALGVVRAAAELGLRVPDDLSLVAFGNPDLIRYATPAMTTIDLPVIEAGRVAADLLIEQISRRQRSETAATDGSDAARTRVLGPRLLVRETTRALESSAQREEASNTISR